MIDLHLEASLFHELATRKKSSKQSLRLFEQFRLFVAKEWPRIGQQSTGYQLTAFAESARVERGLKFSSTVTYSKGVRNQVFDHAEDLPVSNMPMFADYIKRCEVLSMDEKTDHALDIKESYIKDALGKLDLDVATSLALILISSGRHQGITDVRGMQLVDGQLHVDWGVEKNRRQLKLRRSNVYDVPEWLKLTKKIMKRMEDLMKDPIVLTVDQINAALTAIPYKGATTDKHKFPTTFSFRRFAIQSFIKKFTDDKKKVDWERVIEMTGHLHKDIPANIYQRTALELLEDAETEEEMEDGIESV